MTSTGQVFPLVPRKALLGGWAISLGNRDRGSVPASHLSTPGLALSNVPVVLQLDRGCVSSQDFNLPQLRCVNFMEMVGCESGAAAATIPLKVVQM